MSQLIGVVLIVTLKARGVMGAGSVAVLATRQQRRAARNEIIKRGALFVVLMAIF